MKRQYSIKKVFLAGFSNGAFFISKLIQTEKELPFDGFYMRGGGCVEEGGNMTHHYPVVLEVGLFDIYHFSCVRKLRDHLIRHGWKNLRYNETFDGHTPNYNFDLFRLKLNVA